MARKIRKPPEAKENLDRWLLTYADMITLLMLFFIILYSLSSVNQAKFTEMQQAFANVFNGGDFTIFDTRSAGGAGVLSGVSAGQKIVSKQTTGGKNTGPAASRCFAPRPFPRFRTWSRPAR